MFATGVTVTAIQPLPKLPEPANETKIIIAPNSLLSLITDPTFGFDPTPPVEIPIQIQRAYRKAQQIDKKHYPYVWGGGHVGTFAPSTGLAGFIGSDIIGYDCSGSVSAVIHAAFTPPIMGPEIGRIDTPYVAIGFRKWGVAGVGKYLTVWASTNHVFIEFNIPGRGLQHWGTGRFGTGRSGPGFKPNLHPHGGFVPRHIPGM